MRLNIRIYEGGLAQALSLVNAATEADDADANVAQAPVVNDFKFFFNYCQFSPVELETMLDVIDPETGDAVDILRGSTRIDIRRMG
jgi:hypothetical protein